MATSGSVNSSKARDSYFRVAWERTGTSIPNNTSTIKWTLYLVSGNYWYSNAVRIDSVVINGVTVKGSETYSNKYDETYTLASGTQVISHNTDGTKSFSISVNGWFYGYGNVSGSASFTLDAIPRYATITQSLASATETSITMNWTSDSIIDYLWYSSDNGTTWTGSAISDARSGSYTISGLTANTTYQIKTRVRRKDSGRGTDSSALSVTTYSYPYLSQEYNFNIGDTANLTFYNPLGRTFTFQIIAHSTTLSNTWTVNGTSYALDTSTIKSQLYATIPTLLGANYEIKCICDGNTVTKSGGVYRVNVNDCSPTIGSVSYADVNSSVTAITGNNKNIVRNKSTVRYTASGLSAKYSASITSIKVAVNGNTYTLTRSGTTATGGNASINSGMSVEAVFTLTDSRGLTATKTVTVNMLDWTLPTAIISLQRQNNFYTATNITVDADYSYVDGKNAITITYSGTKDGDTSPTVSGTLQDNVQSTFNADNNYAWTITVKLVDSFGGTTTYSLHLSRGTPIIYFDRLKSSVGVNCFPESDGTLESGGQILTSFKKSVAMGSFQADATDIIGLMDELRFSSGCMGSVNIGTAYTNGNVTIPTGWYNFIYSPHRSGGLNGSANRDNCLYGSLILSGMTVSGLYLLRITKVSGQEVSQIAEAKSLCVKSATNTVNCNYNTVSDRSKLADMSWLAFWDGTWNGSASNLLAQKVAYVKSQGTSGDWRYRVWSNGFIEVWFNGSVTFTSAGASYQGWYRSVQTVTIPTAVRNVTGAFADNANVQVTGAYNAHIYTSGGIRSSGTAFEAQMLGMNAVSANTATSGWSVYISGYKR